MGAIILEGLGKRFGTTEVIRDVSLDIADGELAVIVGPSGCGKSTLLRLIAGLERASAGRILIDGQDVTDRSPGERGLAMVFQSYALYPHMSVRRNLAFGLENTRLPPAEIATRIADVARLLEIEALLDRRPGQLSGGQRQRVAIGRAIVRDPTAFLLDEPLSNLDAELRGAMRAELAALHRRLRRTMIHVTHDQVEAMTLANRIVVLRDGRIEQVGAPLDLFNRPANRFVAGFIGAPAMNFLTLPVPGRDGAVTLGIRPQHLRRGDGGLTLTVDAVENLGAETLVHGRIITGERLTAMLPGQLSLRPGERLPLAHDPANAHRFDAAGLCIHA